MVGVVLCWMGFYVVRCFIMLVIVVLSCVFLLWLMVVGLSLMLMLGVMFLFLMCYLFLGVKKWK